MKLHWICAMFLMSALTCAQLVAIKTDNELTEPGQTPVLELYQDSVTSFVALWTEPLEGDPIIRGYKLGLGIHEPDEKMFMLRPDKRYHRVTNILHHYVYVVSLRAYNDVGDGSPYYETIYTKTDVPTTPIPDEPLLTPTNVTSVTRSAKTILVTWIDHNWADRPPPEDRFYAVRYNPGEETQDYTYVNTTQPSLLIGALVPDTEYYFRVMVVQGESLRVSNWSSPASNRTIGEAPGTPPKSVAVYQIGSGVSIAWATPEEPNSPIAQLEYSVMYTSEALQGDWMTVHAGSRLRVSLSDLVPGRYFFMVVVKNRHGTGPTSRMKMIQI